MESSGVLQNWCYRQSSEEMPATSSSVDLIHMFKAAMVNQDCQHVGCKENKRSGVEGALTRNTYPLQVQL